MEKKQSEQKLHMSIYSNFTENKKSLKETNDDEYNFTVIQEGNFTDVSIKQTDDVIKGTITFETRSLGEPKSNIEKLAKTIIKLIETELD